MENNDLIYNNIEFKSKGEVKIAKFLDECDIKYKYEFPIAVIDNNKTKIWYPDFYLIEFGMIIEYFGLYNSDKNYKKNANHKQNIFFNIGLDFISIYEFKIEWKYFLLKTIYNKTKNKNKKIKLLIKN